MAASRLFTAVVCAGIAVSGLGCYSTKNMSVAERPFGTIEGRPVSLYTLTNNDGLTARITNYGGTVTEFLVPDRNGKFDDVVLGFDRVERYPADSPYFGAMIGRVGNRINQATFNLDGKTYQLNKNNDPHFLHGGSQGWDKVIWDAEVVSTPEGPGLQLTYVSPDGEEGMPGTVKAKVIYTLTNRNELKVEMTATTDKATPINIVHHSYWNLGGHDSGTILDHEMTLNASHYTPADDTLIPTGEIASVEGTPFDFRMAKPIGRDIDKLPPRGADPGGYDVNFVVDGREGSFRGAVRVREPRSGRVMDIYSHEPGLQFYSGNFLDGVSGKDGAYYEKYEGFCLETQHYPDSINKAGREGWPSVVLRPGETYHHLMVHKFYAE